MKAIALRAIEVPAGPAVVELLPHLRAVLDGTGPALLPYSGRAPGLPSGRALPDGAALVVTTSGSTGTPKRAVLTAAALRASAGGTHEYLGGPGQWVLAMPAQHIAGLQVMLRSIAAQEQDSGGPLLVVDACNGFGAAEFAQTTATLAGGRAYTSLVPTQLTRLLADPVGLAALRRYDAVLVGGAASARALLARAEREGVHAVTTYGMSETAGGCVYDGAALSCTRIRLDDGRVWLGGHTLASGYLDRPDLSAAAFVELDGARWFRTDDIGHLDGAGRLRVDGRVDDVVNTGGLKVAPRLVEEAAIAHLPGVSEAVAVGLPDPQWGEVVALVVVTEPGSAVPATELARAVLRDAIPAYALPRLVRAVTSIPTLGPGKPDRAAVKAMLRDSQAGVRH